MITVLHLIPTLEGGGAERQLAILAKEQARRGWKVHIGLRRCGGVNERIVRDSGVVIHQLGDLKYLHPKLIIYIRALIRRTKPDLMQTWLSQMDILGGVVAWWCSVPWIVSERSSSLAYQRTSLINMLRSYFSKGANAIISNSRQGANYWHQVLPRHRHVLTIHNAVDVSAVRSVAPKRFEDLDTGKKYVLSVGRLEAVKGQGTLVRAVNLMPDRKDLRVLIIGNGPLRRELEAMVRAYGLNENISLLSYHPDWWGWLKTASGLVSTSRWEGCPNVVLEAMAAGCPTIVSDIPGHREILDDSSALFVPRDNPTALAAAIGSLLSDKESASQRALGASLRVENSTIARVADAYASVYEEILESEFL